jgi:predicted ATPase
MRINRIAGKNFKSFDDFSIDFNDFDVLIGSNASGKSNIIETLRFLRDIYNHGIQTAIDFQGDIDNILNRNSGNSRKIWLQFTFKSEFGIPSISELYLLQDIFLSKQVKKSPSSKIKEFLGFYAKETVYTLEIDVSKNRKEIKEIKERIELVGFFDIFYQDKWEDPYEIIDEDIMGNPGKIIIQPKNDELIIKYPSIDIKMVDDDIALLFYEPLSEEEAKKAFKSKWKDKNRALINPLIVNRASKKYADNRNFLQTVDRYILPNSNLISILTFDLYPRAMKQGSMINTKTNLDEEGRNLPQILYRILKNEETKKQFLNLLSYVLPFVKDLKISVMEDRSNITMISESYHKDKDLAAAYMSDGTVIIIALITALFFSDGDIIIIEEPERNLHPKVIPQIVELMNESARNRQVIITTHNPEFVRWASLEKLLLVYRNERGGSSVIRPKDIEYVEEFIENEIGIDNIFVNNRFGV